MVFWWEYDSGKKQAKSNGYSQGMPSVPPKILLMN